MHKTILFLFLILNCTLHSVETRDANYQTNTNRLDIPPRSSDAPGGSEFMESIKDMSFAEREEAILEQLLAGNIPSFTRDLVELEAVFNDADGNPHTIKYWVMPDYLSIGSDSNYCRVPMGPLTSQQAANAFGATMPTRKLVDHIYQNAEIKLQPVTYAPVGNQNEKVEKFIEHNTAIQEQFESAGGVEGDLVGGTKKDVVISNKIVDPSRPGHVVIYGWHQLNGQPIQPLTNIHSNTYVDYSHGIRLLDSDIVIDGDTTKVQNVLKDELLYKILSDEFGPMYYPTYIYEIKTPEKPKSFGVISEKEGAVKVVVSPDSVVEYYKLYLSEDGLNFGSPVDFTGNEFTYQGLPADSAVFVRLSAHNSFGSSGYSEVLTVLPKSTPRKEMLIVNGFDRTSEGNTFNFTRQHANAIVRTNTGFVSATNDAVENGLFQLSRYPVVDYILGEESTADETFSDSEQSIMTDYLENGGSLFISGSEIAWDLDYKGTSTDNVFFHNYLKAEYSADAPGGVSGTYYSASGVSGGIFETLNDFYFDDGTHGTYDVEYADALIPKGGADEILHYPEVSEHNIAGVSYEGEFGSSDSTGRLVYLGFPFETIRPAPVRYQMMDLILIFLYNDVTSVEPGNARTPKQFSLYQNYPNPFNPSTTIRFDLPEETGVKLEVFNVLGEKVGTLVNGTLNAGIHRVKFDGSKLSSGTYIYRMRAAEYQQMRKLLLLK